MNRFLLPLLVLGLPSASVAQESAFPLSITPSMRVRSTLMNAFNLGRVRQSIYVPYDYERSFQTVGLGPTIAVGRQVAVSYTPFLRYGYAYSVLERSPDGLQVERVDKKQFILDQQFWLTKQLHYQRERWFKPSALSLGWGIVNTSKRFHIDNPPVRQIVRVETNTLDIAAIFGPPRKAWSYSFAAHYLYDGFATNRTDDFLSYSVMVGYRLLPRKPAENQAQRE